MRFDLSLLNGGTVELTKFGMVLIKTFHVSEKEDETENCGGVDMTKRYANLFVCQTVSWYNFIIDIVIFCVCLQHDITKPPNTEQTVVFLCVFLCGSPLAAWVGPSLVLAIMGPWQAVDEITGAHLYWHPEAYLRSGWGQRQTHTYSCAQIHTHTHKKLSATFHNGFPYTMWRLEIISELIEPSSGQLLSLHLERLLHYKYSE